MKRYEANQNIRKLLGLSGRQLAERVEVTKQTISNYERGLTVIRPVERVIEIELDSLIEKCTDETIRNMCEILKLKRDA
jgi:transcriptional regulator with XRE-family HTH domain